MSGADAQLRIGFIPLADAAAFAGPAFDPDDIAGHLSNWAIERV